MPTRSLSTRQEVEDFVHGLVLYGTGGGGGPAGPVIERVVTAMESGVAVGWTDIDELPDDAWTFSVAGVGGKAPIGGPDPAILERTGLTGHNYDDFRDMVLDGDSHADLASTASSPAASSLVGSGEHGYDNPSPRCSSPARLGIPLIDGDYAGRAKPEIQQSTLEIEGRGVTPLVFIDRWGDRPHTRCHLDGDDRPDRPAPVQRERSAAWPSPGRCCRRPRRASHSCVEPARPPTRWVGSCVKRARVGRTWSRRSPRTSTGGICSMAGSSAPTRSRRAATSSSSPHIIPFTAPAGCRAHHCAIWVKNEHHIVWIDGHPRALSPDIISVHDRETGLPLTNHEIAPGRDVAVIAAPPLDPRWRSAKGIALLGPRAASAIDIDPLDGLNA